MIWIGARAAPIPLAVLAQPCRSRPQLVADAIFKAVEKQGVQVKKGDRRELLMVRAGEQLTFQLRYRLKRGQRQLTPDELRWRGSDAQKWVYELYETDALVFEIKTWLPRGTRAEWEDSKRATLEQQFDDIVAGIMAAFPALVQLRREREEERRRSEIAARGASARMPEGSTPHVSGACSNWLPPGARPSSPERSWRPCGSGCRPVRRQSSASKPPTGSPGRSGRSTNMTGSAAIPARSWNRSPR